jgi:DNA-binding response OmpR family regulator
MPKKIVLVDDEPFATIAYSDALTHAGYDVSVARDGEEALPLIKKIMPDMVLLDIIMPRKDGMTVLKELKSIAELKDIPVLIVSNLSQLSNIEEAKEYGATGFVVKTDVAIHELVARIKKIIGS